VRLVLKAMVNYDTDSSGGEDNDFTETNVLLGYASKEPSDDTISHLGGRPVHTDPESRVSTFVPRSNLLNLLMVIYKMLTSTIDRIG